MTRMIEQLWQELAAGGQGARQRRIDATHPHDLYADFEAPERLGLVAVCSAMPSSVRSLRSIDVETRLRTDGRWSLRISLDNKNLRPVFGAMCRDIVAHTRTGVAAASLPTAILGRVERWRELLERGASGLDEAVLRGLIGELLVLDTLILTALPGAAAIATWTGPLGYPQDFQMPSGTRIEVKTVAPEAGSARISCLEQLDAGNDPLVLAVVRAETTGAAAPGAVTAVGLIDGIRTRLEDDPDAIRDLDAALAGIGWHDHPSHARYAVRPLSIEQYEVGNGFPRLIAGNVPAGVEEAEYSITLPAVRRIVWEFGS